MSAPGRGPERAPGRGPALVAGALALCAGAGWLAWSIARPRAPGPERVREPAPEPEAGERVPVGGTGAAHAASAAAPDAARAEHSGWNAEALRLLQAGELEPAIALLERCVEAEPGEPVFRGNLAEALARLARKLGDGGERRRAIELLERATALAPEREDLAEALARWRAEEAAEAGFWRDLSAHFDLSYDGDRSDILQGGPALLELLEEIYAEQRERLAAEAAPPGRPLRVVLYRKAQFAELTGLGDWAAGAFDGVLRLPVDRLGEERASLGRTLRHELGHAFVRELGGTGVPGWLNEGLAQRLEGRAPGELAAARERLRGAELFALATLGGGLSSWVDPVAIRRAYDQSLVLVEALASEFGEALVLDLVRGCRDGGSPEAVFQRAIGLSLGEWLDRQRDALGALPPSGSGGEPR